MVSRETVSLDDPVVMQDFTENKSDFKGRVHLFWRFTVAYLLTYTGSQM